MIDFFKRNKILLCIIGLGFLCWGRLLFLRGIWWDDWAWVWHYFGSENLSEFMLPIKSLRHEFDGYLLFLNFKLLDIVPEAATNIWNVSKFIVFIINSLLVYYISKSVLHSKSILPQAIAIVYLVSPIVNNLCVVEFGRRLYLFSFLLSVLFSIKSVTKGSFRIPYYLLALFFSLISMIGLESFVFFDLARPIIIFYIIFKKTKEGLSTAVKKTFFYWLPFIVIGILILIHKTGLLIPRTGVYADSYNFMSLSIITIVFRYIKSLIHLFIGNLWYLVKSFPLIGKDLLLTLILQALVAALFVLLVVFRDEETIKTKKANHHILNEAKLVTIFGICLIVIGLFPYVMVRGGYSFGVESRHGLLASVGISIFIPSILFALYYKGLIKKLFCSFLLGGVVFLGVFQCNNAVKSYNNDWQQQRSLWWQFIWRVPDIKDKTYLLIDMPREAGDYFGTWRGSYEFACPLNLLYAKSKNKNQINKHFAESLEKAFNINVERSYLKNRDKIEVKFESYKGVVQKYYPKNLMAVSYHDGYVYLNDEINKSNSSGKVNIEPLLAHVLTDQIIYGNDKVFPLRWIIGPEPKKLNERTFMDKIKDRIFHRKEVQKDWRYYFQKIKLLGIKGDYKGITNLYNEAEKLGVIPRLPKSIPLVVIESFYIVGEVDKANALLWTWAFSPDGSYERALGLLESIKVVKDDPALYAKVKKEIECIW